MAEQSLEFVDAPRAGGAEAKTAMITWMGNLLDDAPRAGGAEAKRCVIGLGRRDLGCTPCRRRRGKVNHNNQKFLH